MNRTVLATGIVLFLIPILFFNSASANDTVYLKSGRILRGKVTEGKAAKGGAFILLETETGAIYKLDAGDIVDTVINRDPVDAEYKIKLRNVSNNSATEHIELAKWCEKQSRKRFKEQIRWHYENVIRLDPDHRNARKKLGYMMLTDGNWVAEAEFKSRQGYVPVKRDWVAEMSRQVAQGDEEADRLLGQKKKQFNRWVAGARRGNFDAASLNAICDPSTVTWVYENAVDLANANQSVELIRVHLDAISNVKTQVAVRMIAHFAMAANNQSLREHAIALLAQRSSNHVLAVLTLNEGLKSGSQWIVHNSAFAIAEVASTEDFSRDHAILPLAESLNTMHTQKIEGALEAGRMNPSFGNGGSGLQMGGGPQTRQVSFQNQPSLDALRRLFEVDFRFNEDAWKEWYINNYTLTDLDVRVDE